MINSSSSMKARELLNCPLTLIKTGEEP